MLNDTDYYTYCLANLKGKEIRDFFEKENLKKKTRLANSNNRNVIITHILEGAGNALVTTGNKLLRIA
jgi:hypothetical protein